tara:strand:- start:56817 stop:58424 length:1608 start_codon:yes stop_codon:yes gene_type:complete
MPTLDWIGKKAVVKHHKDVPYRLLEPVKDLSHGDPESGNLIVQGDNLHALKALLPRYAGKVKCIYIDPPYNTGNEGWVYNDNVNSAEIKQWLGDVVGKEFDDLGRHDKWLCMMYPRLLLLKQFLTSDGAIFISIDDNEVATLRLLMDEIFGKSNFIASVLWQKVYSPKNSARHLSEDHDYVLIYALSANAWRPNLLPRTEDQNAAYKNPDNDARGNWKTGDLSARNHYSAGTYAITCPSGRVISAPPKGMYWRVSRERFDILNADNRIWWGKDGNAIPQIKRFLSEVKDGRVPQTMWFYKEVGHSQEAKKELIELVNFESSDDVFITPKPTRLIQRILQIGSDKDSIILDSFAGSGTTGHAVLKQNSEDGGSRKVIMVEMDSNIASNVTVARMDSVVNGYTTAKDKEIDGLGGGFQFCRLSEKPLFNANGQIREDVTFAQLAEFIWFSECGSGFTGETNSPLLGVFEGRAIFLLYNGILKDKSINGGNVLTTPVLDILPKFDGPKVIYAAACRLGKTRMDKLGVQFKQTPYALEI